MTQSLFVQNILPSITDEQLHTVFSSMGGVVDVQRPFNRLTLEPRRYAFVVMETEEAAQKAIEHLSGYELEGQQMLVRPVDPNKQGHEVNYRRVREVGVEIAEKLGETEQRPRGQIIHLIEMKGTDFALQLLQDTLKVQEEGGMEVTDGSRKRTTGGIFFKLAKDRLDAKTRGIVFPAQASKKKKAKKGGKPDDKKQQKKAKPGAQKGGHKGDRKKPSQKPRFTKSRLDPLSVASAAAARAGLAPPQTRELTPEVEAEYHELKEAEAAAQRRLAEIQAKKAKGSPIAALKELADLKAKIAQLVKTYPDLQK